MKSTDKFDEITLPTDPPILKKNYTLSLTTNNKASLYTDKDFKTMDNLENEDSISNEHAFISSFIPSVNKVKFISSSQELMKKQFSQNIEFIKQAIENYIQSVDEFVKIKQNFEAIEVIK